VIGDDGQSLCAGRFDRSGSYLGPAQGLH